MGSGVVKQQGVGHMDDGMGSGGDDDEDGDGDVNGR